MKNIYEEEFWESYSEHHFWQLNDKAKVKENSLYYDKIYDSLLPGNRAVRILDIGCGGGHFLAYLTRKNYVNIEGIDIARGLVQFVKKAVCSNVQQCDALEYLRKKPGVYDVLVANDFIEHLSKADIIEFLSLCHGALAERGILLLKTPNMCNPFASRNRYVDFTHETGFTEHSLYAVCAAARFCQVGIFSEHHASAEPKIFTWFRRLYMWTGQDPPKILSTNLIAVCRK